jgi:pimeloyl-ACP methyl ester carboxylesterase
VIDHDASPQRVDLHQHWISSGDNWLSAAYLHREYSPTKARWFVFLHGWTSWKDERDYAHVKLARRLTEVAGHAAVLFDYRGHGESTGRLEDVSLDSLVEDANNVLIWLNQKDCAAEVFVVAAAVSAVVGLQIATKWPLSGLVLLSPALVIPKALQAFMHLGRISVAELLVMARHRGDEQAVRQGLLGMGMLPDHAAGETINTNFWVHPAFLDPARIVNACPCPVQVCFDPSEPVDTQWLADQNQVELQGFMGGGTMFRHPILLDELAESIARWARATAKAQPINPSPTKKERE